MNTQTQESNSDKSDKAFFKKCLSLSIATGILVAAAGSWASYEFFKQEAIVHELEYASIGTSWLRPGMEDDTVFSTSEWIAYEKALDTQAAKINDEEDVPLEIWWPGLKERAVSAIGELKDQLRESSKIEAKYFAIEISMDTCKNKDSSLFSTWKRIHESDKLPEGEIAMSKAVKSLTYSLCKN